MVIYSLRITDFRNLSSVELVPCQNGLNIISGDNGSGKTNLLEAIYYLGLGKSFRQATSRCLIRHAQDEFSLFAQLVSQREADHDGYTTIGMQRALTGSLRLRMTDNHLPSMTELAHFLPIRLIHSQSHHFFELGPVFRRKYLDWGLFYQCDPFLSCWHYYMRMLRQRNAALRQHRTRQEVEVWTKELVKYGVEFDVLRRTYLNTLIPLIMEMAQELLPAFPLQVTYHPGWDNTLDFASALAHVYREECRLGFTQYGPHRADIAVTVQGVPVRHILSRGQQKLLICAMIIAQGILLARQAKKSPIYLIDDLPAELDGQSRKKLLALFSKLNTQVFITAIESQPLCDVLNNPFGVVSSKVFHVEHGKLLDT